MITNYAHFVKELRYLVLVLMSEQYLVCFFPLGSRPVKA